MDELTIDQKLQNYFDLKTEIAVMTESLNKKKEEITEFLKKQTGMKYSVGDIGFSLRATPIYQYTNTVLALEENVKLIDAKIKEVKKNEIETGDAKVVNTQYAVYIK